MNEKSELNNKRKLEKISWNTFMTSYFGQLATSLFTHSPSGLEQYLNNPTGHIAGALLTIGGASYTIYSIHNSSGCYKEKGLVTNGQHSILRHPIYSGFRLSSLGMMIINPSLENLIAGAAVFITTEITARMEDEKLLKLYGTEFIEYQNNVPKWIPYAKHIKQELKKIGTYIANIFKKPTSSE